MQHTKSHFMLFLVLGRAELFHITGTETGNWAAYMRLQRSL
jgi:hypothetical protein